MLKSAEQYRNIFIENNVNKELEMIDKLLTEAVQSGETSIRVENLTDLAVIKIREQGLFIGQYSSNNKVFYVISIYELEGAESTGTKEEHARVAQDIEEFMKDLAGRLKNSAINRVNNIKDSVKLEDGVLAMDFSALVGKKDVDKDTANSIFSLVACLISEGYTIEHIQAYVKHLGYDISEKEIRVIINSLEF